ncbi:MAG TPA: hypothetical protein VF556_03215 [Pyrinomonadaceae bacterium]
MILLYKDAAICFSIINENEEMHFQENKTLEILHFVKNHQIKKADVSKILSEEKVKNYDDKLMYIIKCNLFKNWTTRQAIKDAREELNLIMLILSKKKD